VQATATLDQLRELTAIGWLSEEDGSILQDAVHHLRQQGMMASLLPGQPAEPCDTGPSARIFERRLGGSAQTSSRKI
jgi:hypothetical protein